MTRSARSAIWATSCSQIVNLNTLGSEIDNVLGQYGLQMRQGDIYLSSLAAERLGARPGDVVEVFVGPMPVRFRVRDVVEQAGPMSALVPVVMMPLDEAQQLLFMNDKVNTVLSLQCWRRDGRSSVHRRSDTSSIRIGHGPCGAVCHRRNAASTGSCGCDKGRNAESAPEPERRSR